MSFTQENISNFDNCYKFFEREYSQSELYAFLKSGTLAEKQLACIRIENVNTQEEANILMQNLTGIDGKVRETVSFKLKTFVPAQKSLFLNSEFYDIFLDAIIDINGNICRNVITTLQDLCTEDEVCQYLTEKIIQRAQFVVDTIENFSHKDRKYVTNKEVFKLYWYLETLNIFKTLPADSLFNLLKRCAKIDEYTIREKTANLLRKLPAEKTIRPEEINYDQNFYVDLALKNNS